MSRVTNNAEAVERARHSLREIERFALSLRKIYLIGNGQIVLGVMRARDAAISSEPTWQEAVWREALAGRPLFTLKPGHPALDMSDDLDDDGLDGGPRCRFRNDDLDDDPIDDADELGDAPPRRRRKMRGLPGMLVDDFGVVADVTEMRRWRSQSSRHQMTRARLTRLGSLSASLMKPGTPAVVFWGDSAERGYVKSLVRHGGTRRRLGERRPDTAWYTATLSMRDGRTWFPLESDGPDDDDTRWCVGADGDELVFWANERPSWLALSVGERVAYLERCRGLSLTSRYEGARPVSLTLVSSKEA